MPWICNNILCLIRALGLAIVICSSLAAAEGRIPPIMPAAEPDPPTYRSMQLSTDVLLDILGFNIQYAIKISRDTALSFRAITPAGLSLAYGYAAGGTIGSRIYFMDLPFYDGWYVEPFLGALVLQTSLLSDKPMAIVLVAAEVGYAWHWDNGFLINLGLRFGVAGRVENPDDLKFYPIANPAFSLGYAW